MIDSDALSRDLFLWQQDATAANNSVIVDVFRMRSNAQLMRRSTTQQRISQRHAAAAAAATSSVLTDICRYGLLAFFMLIKLCFF